MHPRASDPLPPVPAIAVLCSAPTADVESALKRGVACGAAPGPTGWTGEMLSVLSRNAFCLEAITRIVNWFNHERMSERLRRVMKCARTLPIAKDGGGIRPIAMCEAIYKLAVSIPMFKLRGKF